MTCKGKTAMNGFVLWFGRQRAPVAIRRRSQLYLEELEARCLLDASTFYSFSGMGDNLTHPNWGAAGQDLLRTAPAQYGDGVSTLAGADRPSARVISDLIVSDATNGGLTNSRLMSDWIYAWGQFLDHDLDLTTRTGPRSSTSTAPSSTPAPAGTESPASRSTISPPGSTGR
jgi:hypothetical protein